MDLDDKVIESFGIKSIPTKLVIDRKGHIRFRKLGFEGNAEKMAEELIHMIDIIR